MKKTILGLIIAAVCCLGATASTLTNTFYKGNGSAYYGPVTLKPRSTPLLDDPDIIVGLNIVIQTTTNGFFTATLKPGIYEMSTATTDRHVLIDVPDDSTTYTLGSRITTSLAYAGSGLPSTLEWTADLALKANIASPTLTGSPTTPRLVISNNGATPATPASGFVLWCTNNILKVIGKDGTVTTLASP